VAGELFSGLAVQFDDDSPFGPPAGARSARNDMLTRSVLAVLLVLFCSAQLGCATADSQVAGLPSPKSATPTMPVASATPRPTDTIEAPTHTPEPSDTPSPSPTVIPSLSPTRLPSKTPTPLGPLVAVDPGHGGQDLGARHFDASGHMDFNEAQVNLDLALRLRDLLVQRGYRVLLTRDGDYQLHEDGEDVNGDGHHEYVVDENQARIDVINASDAELLLAIHQNASAILLIDPCNDAKRRRLAAA